MENCGQKVAGVEESGERISGGVRSRGVATGVSGCQGVGNGCTGLGGDEMPAGGCHIHTSPPALQRPSCPAFCLLGPALFTQV